MFVWPGRCAWVGGVLIYGLGQCRRHHTHHAGTRHDSQPSSSLAPAEKALASGPWLEFADAIDDRDGPGQGSLLRGEGF